MGDAAVSGEKQHLRLPTKVRPRLLKSSIATRLREAVEHHVPTVREHIAYVELSTPVTTRHLINYEQGEIYGIAATPRRYLTRRLGARMPICELFLTGQDAVSLGVVGALC